MNRNRSFSFDLNQLDSFYEYKYQDKENYLSKTLSYIYYFCCFRPCND